MNRLEHYYENINPALTPEELTERVTANKTENIKIRRKPCRLIGAIAAAVTALSLGITAAANDWSYADIFRNIFGENAENLSNNIIEEAVVTANSTKKMDFQLVAAAADSNSVLMIVDVTAKNGFKLGQNHIGDARADVNYAVNIINYNGGYSQKIKVISGDENKARVRIQIESSRDITGKDITLTIWEYTDEKPEDVDISEIYHYTYSDDNGERVYRYRDTETQWQVKFTAEGESESYELDHGVTFTLSPISASFTGENGVPVTHQHVLTIVTKDGEKIKAQNPGMGHGWSETEKYFNATFAFNEPINLDEIKEIKLGTRTILEF